jgi:hypothetical protein
MEHSSRSLLYLAWHKSAFLHAFQNCNSLDDANEILNPLQLLFILRNSEIPVIEARENR